MQPVIIIFQNKIGKCKVVLGTFREVQQLEFGVLDVAKYYKEGMKVLHLRC